MDTSQQIMIFLAMTLALCYGWYKKNAKEAARKQVIQNEYLSSLKKLKGNPKDKKLKANVIEKGSAYYMSIKKSSERLNQSDFDAIDYDISEVLKDPKALKDIKLK